jgi:hypothetical protein
VALELVIHFGNQIEGGHTVAQPGQHIGEGRLGYRPGMAHNRQLVFILNQAQWAHYWRCRDKPRRRAQCLDAQKRLSPGAVVERDSRGSGHAKRIKYIPRQHCRVAIVG